MKTAIVTAIIGDSHRRLAEVSLPPMKKYADRIGAKFVMILQRQFPVHAPHWEKMQLRDVLSSCDRVAWMDVDLVVSPKAPSIFEAAPAGHLSAFDEGKVFTDRENQFPPEIVHYKIQIPPAAARQFSYFNSGVMVVDAVHRDLFVLPQDPKRDSIMHDQTYLNLRAHALKLPFHDLTSRWNGLHSIHPKSERHTLWTVHYAGYPKTADWVDRVRLEMLVDLARFV